MSDFPAVPAPPPPPLRPPPSLRPPPPRELLHWRFAGLLVATAVPLGLLQAWVWSLLAPGVTVKVYTDGTFATLPNESWLAFSAVAIFLLLLVLVGVWQAVAVWSRRALRGTLTLVTLAGAAAVSALTAWLLGPVLSSGTDPASVGASAAESLVVTAPHLDGMWPAVLLQPFVAIVVYTVLSAWHASRDLGTGVPQPAPITRRP